MGVVPADGQQPQAAAEPGGSSASASGVNGADVGTVKRRKDILQERRRKDTHPRRVEGVLLRECVSGNKKMHWDDDYLELDGQRVHRSTKCGYRLGPADALLDIGSVWYMFREISGDKSYTNESTRKRGFKYISVASRGDLIDWLVGRNEYCPGIARDVIEGKARVSESLDESKRRPEKRPASEISGPSSVRTAKKGDISYADVMRRVRPVKDLDVLVRCPGRTVPNADLILKIAQDEVANWRMERRGPDIRAATGKIPLLKELEQMILENESYRPIILVPCSKNCPVNLLNASKLLQDGEFSARDEERVRFFESTRPEYVEIVRNIMGNRWTFEVRDSVKGFSKAQWLRVVSVITDGNEWQFKGWPFESTVDLFATCKGIFFNEVGTQPPTHVIDWNVSILKLGSLQFQHRFAAVRDAFWIEVEKFLSEYRQKRFVNHTTLQPERRVYFKTKPIL
jgi:hypothetical protein